MFEESLPRLLRPRPPGHELPRARRHHGQPRGPAAAPAPRRDRAVPGRARLDREARRALRRRALAPRLARLRGDLRDLLRRHPFGAVGEHARAAGRAPRRSQPLPDPPAEASSPTGDGLRLLTYRPLFSGAAVERTPELAVPAAGRRDRARAPRRARPRHRDRRHRHRVVERHVGRSLRARIARDLPPAWPACRGPRPRGCTSSSR